MQLDRFAVHFRLAADIDQQALHRADIAHPRDAPQRDRFVGEQRSRQCGQCRILRSARRDLALQTRAAFDDKFIHERFRLYVGRASRPAAGLQTRLLA